MAVTANLMITLALLIGIILLQLKLSRCKSKWPGLIFPILSFLFALLYPLNMVAPSVDITAGFIMQLLLVWLAANIPTILLLAIYFCCRETKRRAKQLEKMHIQDLS